MEQKDEYMRQNENNLNMLQDRNSKFDELLEKFNRDQINIRRSIQILTNANSKLSEVFKELKDVKHMDMINTITNNVTEAVNIITKDEVKKEMVEYAEALRKFKEAFQKQQSLAKSSTRTAVTPSTATKKVAVTKKKVVST